MSERIAKVERPILFSGAMVRAILAGRKTQTRRAVKPQPQKIAKITARPSGGFFIEKWQKGEREMDNFCRCEDLECPYGQTGDRLWVRETFRRVAAGEVVGGEGMARYGTAYAADGYVDWSKIETKLTGGWPDTKSPMQFDPPPWKPSIHMPRRFCRLTLEIASVRVERLQAISNEDCFAEGLPADTTKGNRTWYGDLWETINGKGSWDANPWVWVVEFKRLGETKQPASSQKPAEPN